MIISPDVIELIVAVIVGAAGKFGYDKTRSFVSNDKSRYLTRETHDRECGMKLQPIISTLTRIENHVEEIAKRSR